MALWGVYPKTEIILLIYNCNKDTERYLIPHDFNDYRPPKKQDSKITGTDYLVIGLTTFGVYTCTITGSFFNLVLVMLAWRFYERYRSGKYD